METGTPEFSRPPKAGLLRAMPATGQAGRGTQAPGEGFALTIAARECAKLQFQHEHDRHDVALAVGLVAAKRASLIGRGPQLSDVQVAMDLYGLRDAPIVTGQLSEPFRGLAHSYVLQRRFVDAVDGDMLVTTGSVPPL
jgi:hypothetical protein